MNFIELESERLIFRKFKQEDLPVISEFFGNAENMKYRMSEPKTEIETREYLNRIISGEDVKEGNYTFAVDLKSENLLIGYCGFFNMPNAPEVHWFLHNTYWRQGYGTEIGRTMLRFGFETLNLRRIIAGCNARNTGSYKIMEKIGMRREANFIKAQKGNSALNYEWCDRLQYAILKEEWEANK